MGSTVRTVNVVWVSYHKPKIISRGYWDQGLLEHLFQGRVWTTPHWMSFEHHDGFDSLHKDDGAIVIVPARWHVQEIDQLNKDISKLPWVLLILTGDEEAVFPWEAVEHPNIKVWVQTPDPKLHARVDRKLGDYWPYDVPDAVREARKAEDIPERLWFFSGQVNNEQRRTYAAEMVRRRQKLQDGQEHTTPEFGSGMERKEYIRELANAKAAPSPSGNFTPDTFRLFEALEAGCVPIPEAGALKERVPSALCSSGFGYYWPFLFDGEPPFPVLRDIQYFNETLDYVRDYFPHLNNKVYAWWQGKKREIAYWLKEDYEALCGHRDLETGVNDKLTVLIPTSPVPIHPDTSHIEETVKSVRDRLPYCEIFILIDGVHAEQGDRFESYGEYVRRLLWLTNNEWNNVLPLYFSNHQHQANMTREALKLVKTPCIMFVEHDTPLVGEADYNGICNAVWSGEVDLVRLHHEASILEPHKHLMLDERPIDVAGVPLMRTVQWSQRPHITTTSYYREMIKRNFGLESRTMIEDVMYGVLYNSWRVHKMQGWSHNKVAIYTPEGDIKRSTHLDSRGDDPKVTMKWAYDGPTPEGAPNPR